MLYAMAKSRIKIRPHLLRTNYQVNWKDGMMEVWKNGSNRYRDHEETYGKERDYNFYLVVLRGGTGTENAEDLPPEIVHGHQDKDR